MKPFNLFSKVNFDCDRCRGEFYRETAYSVAQDREEFNHFPTLCFNCVRIVKEEEKPKKLDKRILNKTGRTHQLGTRVKKEFLKKLKLISRKEKLMYVEVLERALDCYAERTPTLKK